ncbi:hypothetical protein [Aquimarina sp. AU474]|uniref:hypothetical protein n=1 Tax=Aquimarina sp. AU474 TaxID=2108529 RepID=UPI000D695BE6|nr:hypothetical protein [Aquimarina sp. AU474]
MLKNILHLENVKKIDKKQQKVIAGGAFSNYCGSCCQYCRSVGHDTGAVYFNGECYCSNYRD